MAKLAGLMLALGIVLYGLGVSADPPGPGEASDSPGPGEASDSPGPGEASDSPGSRAAEPDRTEKEPVRKPRTVRRWEVLDVVDGDTVHVDYRGDDVSVRVIGIDTPETVHPSLPDECWGPAASAEASRLLSGAHVRLVFDRSQGRTDAYGRMLAYVEIPRVGDFGLAMIRRGHAAEYTYDTAYARQRTYQAADDRSRSAGRGLWGRCGGPDVPLHKPAPTPAKQRALAGRCAPGYDPCVPPYTPDVDCADVNGPVYVTGSDPHGLDADGDGVACET